MTEEKLRLPDIIAVEAYKTFSYPNGQGEGPDVFDMSQCIGSAQERGIVNSEVKCTNQRDGDLAFEAVLSREE
jgi:hypothetical protein